MDVTNDQIRDLQAQALRTGDSALLFVCRLALDYTGNPNQADARNVAAAIVRDRDVARIHGWDGLSPANPGGAGDGGGARGFLGNMS